MINYIVILIYISLIYKELESLFWLLFFFVHLKKIFLIEV